MEMFEVGGCVRDEILGLKSKDIDFSCIMEDADIAAYSAHGTFTPYEYMVFYLEGMGVKVFKDNDGKPVGADHFTARGQAPKDFPNHPGRALDFVLARKEGEYSDGRRPDSVEVGTLHDDLARRDFTMNAIAKAEDGTFIDPFDGMADITEGVIRAVGNPLDRLREDALRALRAMRFAVTKDFLIDSDLFKAMEHPHVIHAIMNNISDERIQIEVDKMLAHDTMHSLFWFNERPTLTEAIFSGSVSLTATMKKRK